MTINIDVRGLRVVRVGGMGREGDSMSESMRYVVSDFINLIRILRKKGIDFDEQEDGFTLKVCVASINWFLNDQDFDKETIAQIWAGDHQII